MKEFIEKLIGRLEELKDQYGKQSFAYNDVNKTYEFVGREQTTGLIIEIVNELAEKYNNGWIPCSERLPERNEVVLCWVTSTTIASGSTYIIGSCDHGFWFLQTYEIGHHHFPVKDYKVIAWQPLPAPYKEGE